MHSILEIKRLDINCDSHTRPIYCCAFSPQGDLLATTGGDNRISLFRIQHIGGNTALRRVGQVQDAHCQDINSLCFHPSGDFLFSAGDDCIVKVWKVAYEHL